MTKVPGEVPTSSANLTPEEIDELRSGVFALPNPIIRPDGTVQTELTDEQVAAAHARMQAALNPED